MLLIKKATTIVILALVSYTPSCAKTQDCGSHKENWRVSECASSMYSQGLITEHQYVRYLALAIQMSDTSVDYYSLGITTGAENKLVAGKIRDPTFSRSVSLNYSPKGIYFTKRLIDLAANFSRGFPANKHHEQL